jgi:hypothetical protein
MSIAPIFDLLKYRQDKKLQKQHPQQEPLPGHEGEPEFPQPPFLPAA